MPRYQKGDYLIGADYPAIHVGGSTPPPPRPSPAPVRYGEPSRSKAPPSFMPIAAQLDTIAARLDALAQRVRSARTRT